MLSVILPFQMPRTLSLPQYHMLCANVSMTPRWQTSHTRYINSLHRRTLLVKRVLVTHLDMHLNTLGISSMYMGERGLGPQFQVAFSTEDNSQETVPSLGFQTWNQVLT